MAYQTRLLKKLRQQILQDAIEGKLTADWRGGTKDIAPACNLLMRLSAEKENLGKSVSKNQESLSAPQKSDEPFSIPDSWSWTKLLNICSKTGSGSTPRGGKAVYTKKGIKFIRSQNVFNTELSLRDVVYIDNQTHEKMKGTKVQANDLLLNITGGSIGRCALVPKDFDTANINQHVAIIRSIDSQISTYLHKVLISDYFQKKIIEEQTGAGREGLPKNKMDELLVPLPPLEEQKIIVSKVETLSTICDQLEDQITRNQEHASHLMQAVLKEAFTHTKDKPQATDNVVQFELMPYDDNGHERSKLLGAEIVYQMHRKQTLGHKKLQKVFYICQKTQNLNLPTNFQQHAAGPYDYDLARAIDSGLQKNNWFAYQRVAKFKYKPLQDAGTHRKAFEKVFQDKVVGINHVVSLFKDKTSDEAEAVATLYACWEEILNSESSFSKEVLIEKFFAWSDEKRKFSERQLNEVIAWMEKHDIYPQTRNVG